MVNNHEPRNMKYAIRKLVLSAFILSRIEVVEGTHKKLLFMQNKAKLPDARINVTSVLTKHYENETLG